MAAQLAPLPPLPDTATLDRLIGERLDALLPKKLAELRAQQTPSMTIIATKGTLDWAYPPFILASTASALGWNVSMFLPSTAWACSGKTSAT